MEHTNNTISHHQGAATAGQCSNKMDPIPPPDDQDVQIIGGGSNYWQDWEDEVRFNSGRTHTRETVPRHPCGTDNDTAGQLVIPELDSANRLLIAEHCGEYVEEHCNDPLDDKKDINTPLDLTIEADRQLKQPYIATDDPNSQSEIEDDSHLPTKA